MGHRLERCRKNVCCLYLIHPYNPDSDSQCLTVNIGKKPIPLQGRKGFRIPYPKMKGWSGENNRCRNYGSCKRSSACFIDPCNVAAALVKGILLIGGIHVLQLGLCSFLYPCCLAPQISQIVELCPSHDALAYHFNALY